MSLEKESVRNKYIMLIAIAILVILSYLIIKSFLVSLINAFILAYLINPIFKKLNKKFSKGLSASISILILTLIIIIPSIMLGAKIITQAPALIQENSINSILSLISEKAVEIGIKVDVKSLAEKAVSLLVNLLNSTIILIPHLIFSVIITLMGIYFILYNWTIMSTKIRHFIPFKDREVIVKDISNSTKAIIYGSVLVGFIEFVISAIGFYIAGVKSYLFLSLLIFLFAFIPGLGPAAVWVPTFVYYLVKSASYFTPITILVTGLIVSILIDTILRTKILSKSANINPLIMLMGILGGIPLFGIFGFIIGPLVLVYAIKIIDDYLIAP